MKVSKSCCSILVLQVAIALTIAMINAQDDQSDFISIDCGITQGSKYTDTRTGINYVSDAGFIDTGVSREIMSAYNSSTLDFQLSTLTSFPVNTRNCYTLRPKQGKGNRYLIRARFMYGNYDFKGQPPQFDLYLGSDHWHAVDFKVSLTMDYEIIHLTSSDYIYVCLVNIGLGNPFISALELRLLDSTMYAAHLQSLILMERSNLGTSETIRYTDDKYDRIWYPLPIYGGKDVQTSSDTVSLAKEKVPSKVMNTATTFRNATDYFYFTWQVNATEEFFLYLHFAEIEILESNQTRMFTIAKNRFYEYGPISPLNHTTSTYEITIIDTSSYFVTIFAYENSTLPPILNAMELYKAKHLLQRQTEDQDAAAIWSTKSTYGLKRNWQGDPCVSHESMSWDGLKCSNNDTDTPRIISLNLSSSGLSGEIAPALANLTMIQSLDLSCNNLTGAVPKFLASLVFLRTLNIMGNKFTGPIPAELLDKEKNGMLLLSIEGNCNQDTSAREKGSDKNKIVVKVTAPIAAFLVLLTILAILWISKRRRPQNLSIRDELIEPVNQRYTYSEVQRITNGFSTVIGKGGFGTVFHGFIGDVQVAVKMLSESSVQGYKEFQAEVRLLMSVHHKNITSLVGYCDEGSHKGIIYEYMANGNLGVHLFDGSQNALSWEKRLQIGYDAAQGLEYLHHGCKPPIVHRDVKCSNILLNEKFHAKLADFGLSRPFTVEGSSATHVSTGIAGTPGYLDPEYYITNKLTEKSDVYSFGVVLLELITGRRAISQDINIIEWLKSTVTNGSVENIIDPRLQGGYSINTAWKVVELAIACVSYTSVKRPTMNDVAIELKYCLQTEKTRNGKPNNQSGYASFNLEYLGGPNTR